MSRLTPARFAATVEDLVLSHVPSARVSHVLTKENGRVSVKFEGPNSDRVHWLNYHQTILSEDLARDVAPNVALRLTEDLN